MPADKLAVVVIDDRAMPRAAAKVMLAASAVFRFAGEAASADEGLRVARELNPEVVLLDVEMPGVDGEAAARRLHESLPDVSIVAWTVSDDAADLLRMVRAGCAGYVLKDVGPSELERALSAAVRGESPIPRRMVTDVIRAAAETLPSHFEPLRDPLTRRELSVLRLVATGRSSKQIAQRLTIATTSVESHIRNLLRKLDARSRTEAVTIGLRRGLLTLADLTDQPVDPQN